MANWNALIENFFAKTDPENSSVRIAPNGCSETLMLNSESKIGLSLPQELREFYRHCNGIGLGDAPADLPQFIPSIEALPQFIDYARSSFSGTHPEYASRYIPFIDWGNGDSSGFLLNADGTLHDYIFVFSHEHYDYDDKQEIDEFLTPFAESLEELLGR